MAIKRKTESGISSLIKNNNETFAQVQAVWRFLNNDKVDIKSLNSPILGQSIKRINESINKYVLLITDWSELNFNKHKSKKELIKKKNKGDSYQIIYDLQSTIAVDSATGKPIAPIVQNIKTSERVISTYSDNIDKDIKHLDELVQRAKYIKTLDIQKIGVHIVDREGDSAALFRALQKENNKFLIRLKNFYLHWTEKKQDIKTADLAEKIGLGKKFKDINYQGKKVSIYVNETAVEMRRDAYTTTDDGKKQKITQKGDPVKGRFIVVRLVNSDNKVVAIWKLFSNVPDEISTQQLGEWYYFRWKIESYFKLLKSSGFQLESWLQRDAMAIFRRLLVVSYAIVLIWELENNQSKESEKLRQFLMKLSGKATKYNKKQTASGLLSGFWVFMSIIDTLSIYQVDELMQMKSELDFILGFKDV